MTSYMWIVLFATFVFATGQDFGFDLTDALDDKPTPKPDVKPPKKDGELDLFDALNPDLPSEPKKPASNPTKTGGDMDLGDALDDAKKPAPPSGGGGGGFSDSDLHDLAGNDDYKPDGGKRRGGGSSSDSTDTAGETPAQSGTMAGIVSAVGVAILGAASSYFAYQKKKLCFKMQGGQDPESGMNQPGTQSDPQALSNLLKSSNS